MKNYKQYTPIVFTLFVFVSSLSLTAQNLPNSLWKVIYASSEELVKDQPNCRKELIIDNDRSTFWHSRYSTNKELNPHELRIDLGARARISGITLVPRQRNSSGKCTSYEISISDDGISWATTRKGTLYWAGNNDFSEKNIDLKATGRYIRYRHLKTFFNGISDTAVATLAELKVQGEYIMPVAVPDFAFREKPDQLTVNSTLHCKSTSKAFLSNITGYQWKCPGARIKDADKEACEIGFDKPGIYEVSLQVKNNKGFVSEKKYPKPIYVFPAPLIENRFLKIDTCSDEDKEYLHDAINTIDNLPDTYWSTSWDQLVPLPHFIVYDLGATAAISGIGFLPLQDSNYGLITAYRIFVSLDGRKWDIPVATGIANRQDKSLHMVSFQTVKGRYVKFQVDKIIDPGSNFAAFSKFYVYGEYVNPLVQYLWLLPAIVGTLALLFFLLKIRKKKAAKPAENRIIPGDQRAKIPEAATSGDFRTYVYFFGNLRIIHDNEDITASLSPKLKQLFVLMCYYQEGISIHQLGEWLWPGMPPENLINTRGTTIQRLKAALKDIPGLTLVYNQKKWLVQMDESVCFDLQRYNDLKFTIEKQPTLKAVRELCTVVGKPLLIDIDEEWLDPEKEKISNEIIDLFLSLTRETLVLNDKNTLLEVTEVLLAMDELNEEALRLKIRTLISINKQSLAKLAFDNFIKKYRLIYGEDFGRDFTVFVKG